MEEVKKNLIVEQSIGDVNLNALDLVNFNGKTIRLKKGESLYKDGDEATSFFLILEGVVELISHDKMGAEDSKILNANEYFGLVEVVNKCSRQSVSVAKSDSTLLEFDLKPKTPSIEILVEADKNTAEPDAKYDLLFKTAAHRFSKSSAFIYDITESRRNDIAIVIVNQHRCNFLSASDLKNYLFRVIERGEKKVLIDLQQCRIIDSTYLGALVASLRKISSIGGDIRLVCNQAIFTWLFVVTKMDKVFRIFSDLEEGINSFSS